MPRVSKAIGEPLTGISISARRLPISQKWRRELRELDATLGLVGKSTPLTIQRFLDGLDKELAQHRLGEQARDANLTQVPQKQAEEALKHICINGSDSEAVPTRQLEQHASDASTVHTDGEINELGDTEEKDVKLNGAAGKGVGRQENGGASTTPTDLEEAEDAEVEHESTTDPTVESEAAEANAAAGTCSLGGKPSSGCGADVPQKRTHRVPVRPSKNATLSQLLVNGIVAMLLTMPRVTTIRYEESVLLVDQAGLELYCQYDVDGSGALNKAEYSNFASSELDWDERGILEAWKAEDTNSDGKLTFTEFLAASEEQAGDEAGGNGEDEQHSNTGWPPD